MSQQPSSGRQFVPKMGILEPYKTANIAQGRMNVTKKYQDRFMFKVLTLRNVELTYPYFHDGAAKTPEQAVETMGRLQLDKTFAPQEKQDIVAFLKTLTGEQPNIVLPYLPPSGDKTPRPNPK